MHTSTNACERLNPNAGRHCIWESYNAHMYWFLHHLVFFWKFLFFLSSDDIFPSWTSLRGQTVHWIGAHFCVCVFLDSINKSLIMLKFCRNDQKMKEQKKNKGSVLVSESAYNAQNSQFGLVMLEKRIVWNQVSCHLNFCSKINRNGGFTKTTHIFFHCLPLRFCCLAIFYLDSQKRDTSTWCAFFPVKLRRPK